MGETGDDEAQLIQRVHALSALLASGFEAEWVQPKPLDDGTIQMGWYDYAPQIWDGIEAAKDLLGADYEYLQHIDTVRARGVPAASPSDLSTWFTWMSRGERFCDGFLASNIAKGELATITQRLKALIASGEVSSPSAAS